VKFDVLTAEKMRITVFAPESGSSRFLRKFIPVSIITGYHNHKKIFKKEGSV
jgi:hypothetical protein